jgi:osmotically-inducible protein OsmY
MLAANIDFRCGICRQRLPLSGANSMAEQIPDRVIIQQITNKLATRGVRSPCRVTVLSYRGDVTLSGTVEHAHQKGAAVGVASGVAGVKRVVDQMTIKPPERRPNDSEPVG